MENGLQVASKKFDEIEEINSLEFIDNDEKLLVVGKSKDSDEMMLIIWDLYTGGPEMKENFPIVNGRFDCLARTSGNVLLVDENGKVTSVLKKIELERKDPKITYAD